MGANIIDALWNSCGSQHHHTTQYLETCSLADSGRWTDHNEVVNYEANLEFHLIRRTTTTRAHRTYKGIIRAPWVTNTEVGEVGQYTSKLKDWSRATVVKANVDLIGEHADIWGVVP